MCMINDMADSFIPSDKRPESLAEAYYLATVIIRFAQAGGIPRKQKKKAVDDAIASACQGLKLRTLLLGAESAGVVRH